LSTLWWRRTRIILNVGDYGHPTFYVLSPLLQVFLEAESVAVAEPEVFALVFAGAEPSPGVVVLAAEPEVSALAFGVAEPFPEVVVLVAELFVVDLEVSEPGVVFVAVVSVADVAEPQVSVDIAVVFVVLVPVSVVAVELYSSGRPKFFVFPNIYSFPNCSSSV
jgi:hypothetical protein